MTLLFTAAVILARGSSISCCSWNGTARITLGDLFLFAVTCAIAALVGHLLSVRIEDGFRQTRVSEAGASLCSRTYRTSTSKWARTASCRGSVPLALHCSGFRVKR